MRIRNISKQLHSALEARILIRHVSGLSDADIIGADDIDLTKDQETQLNNMIAQRMAGRPIAKIIGFKEFYGRNFIVNDDVLDPRPDSETLIEAVLGYVSTLSRPVRILDLGTGSGCLILTLLSEIPDSSGVAVDVSGEALAVARQNAQHLDVAGRCNFIQSNWLESVEGEFDIIISNPPYIESQDIENLSVDVKKYDPILALDGGDDGLNPYTVILPQIRPHLHKGGMVAFEHGAGQSGRIKRLIENTGLSEIRVHHDLAGHDRVLTAIHK